MHQNLSLRSVQTQKNASTILSRWLLMLEELEMKILESSVAAETMKLLENTSCGYQIMDRSRHTETKYLNDKKTHKAINGKVFNRPNNVSKKLYKIKLVKSNTEHRDPIIVGFFILQYAKLRMLELYGSFFDKIWDVDVLRNGS